MDHRVRIFESEAAMELAKHHVRASCLKWHGPKQSWLVEFTYNCSDEKAKLAAVDYLSSVFTAHNIGFWRRAEVAASGEFYATFEMSEVSLEGYQLA